MVKRTWKSITALDQRTELHLNTDFNVQILLAYFNSFPTVPVRRKHCRLKATVSSFSSCSLVCQTCMSDESDKC